MSTLTLDMIREAGRLLDKTRPTAPHPMSMLGGGISIYVSEYALEETKERLFPYSPHRSKRVRKKLIKRFGGEFRKKPAIWQTPQGFIVHPALYSKLKAQLEVAPERPHRSAVFPW